MHTDARKDARKLVLPLALAQFIASYAATNMNVAIGDIARDLHTTVAGMQTTITLFTLTMASLMIPGSKLTDVWGRKVCFLAGLAVYGVGATLATLAQGQTLMIVGYSLLEGMGSALLIPPIYILITVAFTDPAARARYFGVVSGAAGLGAAAGPLIGGLVTSLVSWRASFLLQILVVGWIIILARRIVDPPRAAVRPRFDALGAVLSAVGLFFVVLGVLQSSTYGWITARKDFKVGDLVVVPQGGLSPVWLFVGIGVLTLAATGWHLWATERAGREPLVHLRLFRKRTANLGLGTQWAQWFTMQGLFFVTSVYLQQVRGYTAIQTGLMLTPATVGILISSACAERFAQRHSQRWLVVAGFTITAAGMVLQLALGGTTSGVLTFAPGLFCIGIGVGAMLTASVNIVQSSFGDSEQGDISGLSRSVSNLGSSLGTAVAGSILIAAAFPGGRPFVLALIALLTVALVGLGLAIAIPRR